MLEALTLVFMLADAPAGQTTMPRRPEPVPTQEPQQGEPQGLPADWLFDKPYTATDDPAFVLSVVEYTRQGLEDARAGAAGLATDELRAAATKIAEQQEKTLSRIEALAKKRDWRLPEKNPGRSGTVPVQGPTRTGANFIVNQIALHQSTLQQFRVQSEGKGDAELRRVLREAIPGYRKNLEMLLGLEL
jgi:hypothetical protein